jgi:hypothetical protein
MDMKVFNLLKECEKQKLEVSYYDKESDSWVLVFENGKSLLIDSVEQIADSESFMKRTLDEELPYAQNMMSLLEIYKREPVKQEHNTDPAIEHQLQTVIDNTPVEPEAKPKAQPVEARLPPTPEPVAAAAPEVVDEPTPSA